MTCCYYRASEAPPQGEALGISLSLAEASVRDALILFFVLSASQRFHDIHPRGTESRQDAADKTHNECKGHRFCDDTYGHGEAEGKLREGLKIKR